jgi:hypothetical protein
MSLPIMPVVANFHLQTLLTSVLSNLALPITIDMVQKANECSAIVANSFWATQVERRRFRQFAREVEHAHTSCVTRLWNFPHSIYLFACRVYSQHLSPLLLYLLFAITYFCFRL